MQHISANSGGNEKCLNNFKSSSNKNNRLSVVKRIVNSLKEAVCNTNFDDVMIKIYCLRMYYSRLPVVRTSTGNKNLIRITEISND